MVLLSYISLEDVYSEEHWCFAGVSKNSSPVSTRLPLYYQSTGGQITILSWLISVGIVVVFVFLSSFPIIAELPSLFTVGVSCSQQIFSRTFGVLY